MRHCPEVCRRPMEQRRLKRAVAPLLWVVSLALLLGGSGAGAQSDRITIRAERVLAPVSPLLFGQNCGPWVHTTPAYVDASSALGVTLLRAPGGNYGDENDLYPNNVADLAALAKMLHAQVSLPARSWRAGTPEKAADPVRSATVERGYGLRTWEIRKEPDLYKNRNNQRGDPVFDIDWYNAQFRAFYEAMQAVDPSVQVAGPVVTGGWREWMPAFIRANVDIVDVLSWHWYPQGREMTDAQLLATPPQIEDQVKAIRGGWKDPLINPKGSQRPMPSLFLSEYAASWATSARQHLGSETGARWAAEVVGRMANAGVEMASYFALQGVGWHGLIGEINDPRPV